MIGDSISSEISFSRQAPKYVFNAYKFALGARRIKNTSYSSNLCFTPVIDSIDDKQFINYVSDVNTNFKTISSNYENHLFLEKNAILYNTTISSNNKDTLEDPEFSHQYMLNIPCSASLSSDYERNRYCKLANDYEFEPWAVNGDEYAAAHMMTMYNFSTKYEQKEYVAYDTAEDLVTESCSYIKPENFTNSGMGNSALRNNMMRCGCAGILISYTDDTYKDEMMIPMMYYEFEKPIYTNSNILNIEWNANGILRLE